MAEYILIAASEDGTPVRWLSASNLRELLANPQDSYGVREWQSALPDPDGDTINGGLPRDTNYWKYGQGLLLRVEVVVPRPSGSYRLPEEDE